MKRWCDVSRGRGSHGDGLEGLRDGGGGGNGREGPLRLNPVLV